MHGQKTVTTLSTRAELLALSYVAKETYRWKRFFRDIRFDPGYELALSRDNQRTIRLLTKEFPQLTTKLKHVDVHHH